MGLRAILGRRLAQFIAAPRHVHSLSVAPAAGHLQASLKIGDVLLVEGHSRVSTAIKYLTQSTWSHAALYVGDLCPRPANSNAEDSGGCFIEADMQDGVRVVPMSFFATQHVRICRPVSLSSAQADQVARFAIERLGNRYDLRHIFDLARFLIPTPPVPLPWRRRMLKLGSGDPTRAICSTLIAQAFEHVSYPILPMLERRAGADPLCPACVEEIYHVRHHSLYVPRDFDVSPFFEIIKPTLAQGFDHTTMHWQAP